MCMCMCVHYATHSNAYAVHVCTHIWISPGNDFFFLIDKYEEMKKKTHAYRAKGTVEWIPKRCDKCRDFIDKSEFRGAIVTALRTFGLTCPG